MYQLDKNSFSISTSGEWDSELFHELMNGKIVSTKEASEHYDELVRVGALQKFKNYYHWAMLCISYALNRNLVKTVETIKNTPKTRSTEIDFKICFQKHAHLWLAILSDNLFALYADKKVGKDDLYHYATALWHAGACELWEVWLKCKGFRDSDLGARKQFATELVELAQKNIQSTLSTNIIDTQKVNQQNWLDKLQNALDEIHAPTHSIAELDSGVRYDFYRVRLERFFDFEKKYREICSSLGISQNNLIIQSVIGESHCFDFKLLKDQSLWQQFGQVQFENALNQFKNPNQFELPVCIGIDEQGNAIFKDLATAPHLFVAGETGSGKSVCMRAIVKSLFALNANKIEVAILDPKKVDYHIFANESTLYNNKIITEIPLMEKFLSETVVIMNGRYGKMQEANAHQWSEYRRQHNEPYRVIVIDEVADLFDTSQTAQDDLVKLAQKARASGIHLILSTQTPNSEIFSQALRANITARIAMKTATAKQSEVILDEVGAERLFGKGDHLIKWGGDKEFAHSYNI